MPNRIKPKRSYTTGAVPTTSDLDVNEIAISWADNKLFTKNAAGNIVSVSLGGSGGSGSIVTAASVAGFPGTGSASNLYITTEDQRIWRWDATASIYVESGPIGGGFAFASVPASAFATGTAGQIAADGSYWYYCSAPNTWVRTALSTWSPVTGIAGLQAWYDASDASTLYDATSGGSLVAADGGVARWEDRSGNGRHFTQSTSGSRPLRKTAIQGGKAVLRFDGSNDFMSVANSTATFAFLHSADSTVFAVVKRTGGASGCFLNTSNGGGTSHNGSVYAIQSGSGTNDRVAHNIFRGQTGTSTCGNGSANGSVAAAFSAFSFVGRPTSETASLRSAMRINAGSVISNNTETASAGTGNAFANLSVGTDNWNVEQGFCGCDIAELIIYNTALSDTDRAAVEQYLISKWGIT